MEVVDVGIVGGGPSGAYCAYKLAKKGVKTVVFDHSYPREKPCGGGISAVALKKFPFLEQFREYGGKSTMLKIISCTNNHTATIDFKGFNVSRRLLDQQLLNQATDNGAVHVKEKVVEVQEQDGLWQIKTERQQVKTRFLVGADGVNSLVRRKTRGAIAKKNLGLTYGYFATGLEDQPTTLKFTAEIPGYIWLFPRIDHVAVGIGSECMYGGKLKATLDRFLQSYCPNIKITSEYAAMLPWATDPAFFAESCAGENWLLIGDAAGHADPLTGEGILYALWSAKLAAKALTENNPKLYDSLWWGQYGQLLQKRTRQRDTYYNPLFVEFSVARHSIQWTQ